MTTLSLLFWLGAAVILALIAYLLYLLHRLRLQRRDAAEVHEQLAAHNQQMHDDRIRSIKLICMAALDGDCDLSEACIRVHKLLSFYPGLQTEAPVRVVAAMYEELREFATHDERLALSVSERHRQDQRRARIEARYRAELLANLEALRARMRELEGSPYDLKLARGSEVSRRAAKADVSLPTASG